MEIHFSLLWVNGLYRGSGEHIG